MAPIDAFVLWLLPGLFLLHDLEETLWLPRWLHRNDNMLATRFPRLAARVLPHTARLGRSAFAWMAAEEFLILVTVTAYAHRCGHYAPWLALSLAFTLHLAVHIVQALVLRRVFPAVVTSVCCLPAGIRMLDVATDRFTGIGIAACAAAGIALAALNLWLLHRIAGRLAAR